MLLCAESYLNLTIVDVTTPEWPKAENNSHLVEIQ